LDGLLPENVFVIDGPSVYVFTIYKTVFMKPYTLYH